MPFLHRHHFVDESWTFNEPNDVELSDLKARGPSAATILRIYREALNGFTVITQRCDKCGEVAFRRAIGRATPRPVPVDHRARVLAGTTRSRS